MFISSSLIKDICVLLFVNHLISLIWAQIHENDLNCNKTGSEFLKIWRECLIYKDFTSIEQLNVCCDAKHFSKSKLASSLQLKFDFSRKKFFNESIDLKCTPSFYTFNSINLKGIEFFDLTFNGSIVSLNQDTIRDKTITLRVANSKLLFYYRDTLIDETNCRHDFFSDKYVGIFSGMQLFDIVLSDNTDLTSPLCSYIFNYGNLNSLSFEGIVHGYIENRVFTFTEITDQASETSTAVIMKLELNLYQVDIDSNLLFASAFGSIRSLVINGKPGNFESNIFKAFKYLRNIKMTVDSVHDIFDTSTNKWLSSILFNDTEYETIEERIDVLEIHKDRRFSRISFAEKIGTYKYEDENFCLFQYYPYKRLIALTFYHQDEFYLKLNEPANKTCLYWFLVQNIFFVFKDEVAKSDIEELNVSLKECQIKDKLSMCFNASSDSTPKSSHFYFGQQDLIYTLKWFELIGPVISFPIVSALGFVLNLLVILVILKPRKTKEQLLDSKIFKYILLNSTFNCLECLIYQFKLMSTCIGLHSTFCSSIIYTQFTYYFSIILNGYMSETLKSCSILTGLLFSLQRYVETSKNELRILVAFSKVGMRRITIFVVILGLLISVFKFFDYYDYYGDLADSSQQFPKKFAISVYTISNTCFYEILYFFYYIFNDLVLIIINLSIDIMLVVVIKRNLELKVKIKTAHQDTSNKRDEKKLKEEIDNKRKVENKANALIISSFVVYLFCRFPELITSFYYYFNGFFTNKFICTDNSLCYLISDTIEYFYMISYLMNFFFYLKFNLDFQKSFHSFIGRKRSKKENL